MRRVNSWDGEIRDPNTPLTDGEKNVICERVIEKFPSRKTNRAFYAAIVVFVAERDPPPDTVEVAMRMFSDLSSPKSQIEGARRVLSRLRDAGILRKTYMGGIVGPVARAYGGELAVTGFDRPTWVKEHTAHWRLRVDRRTR